MNVRPSGSGLRRVPAVAVTLLLALMSVQILNVTRGSAAATRYEAENGTFSAGSTVDSDHPGYSGSGFVNTENAVGAYVQWDVSAAAGGDVTLGFRYSNGTSADRPMDVSVNGATVASGVSFPPTADWDTWATRTLDAQLNSGSNTVRVTATSAGGAPNLDYLDTEATAQTVYQAEDATISQGTVAADHSGYTGTGFVDYTNTTGSYVQFSVGAAVAGGTALTFRYANGTATDRPMDISVNGTVVASGVSFPPTANWDTWATRTVNADLSDGGDTVRATATTANGGPNLDELTIGGPGNGGGPAVPFGSHLYPYAAGTLKPTGPQSTIDQAVVSFYDRWKAAFVKHNCGNGWYEIYSPDADHPYVGEGQGYGMVITALMAGADPDARTIFDGLVKYMLAHPSVHNPDLLAAEQDGSCKSVDGSDSATDGDLDVAYGLLLADRQWGSSGTYDYHALAIRHINAIKANEVNRSTHLMLLGDWSTSGDSYYDISRSSDWLIDHFRAFRRATGDGAWDTIRSAHQNLITSQQTGYAPNTGLLADFVVDTGSTPRPASGEVLESSHDGDYYWNACRDPWRIAADAVTSGDGASLASARRLNSWIKSKTGGDPDKIVTGYHLSGSSFDSGTDMAFTAPFAVAALTDPGSQAWLDALWRKMAGASVDPSLYYGASVQLQSMIVTSGNYWVP